MDTPAGFREIEHTADWALHVWASDLPGLLEQAARGMYALAQTRLAGERRQPWELAIPFVDRESMLVDFLSELLFAAEERGVAFDEYDLHFDGITLQARLGGALITWQAKEIKAVTYHNLAVRQREAGLEAEIVFDV